MKTKIMKLILLLIATNSLELIACDRFGVTGFISEEDMNNIISLGVSDIDQKEFNYVLDRIDSIYAPEFQKRNANLIIERRWDDDTKNAYAQQTGNDWKISMFGGLARHEAITSDAFALVACHEIGHHIGGAPKKRSFFSTSWASNEGQADYWANLKCMRRYMLDDNNESIVNSMSSVDPYARQKCENAFSDFDDNEFYMCLRSSMAGLSLANFFKSLRNTNKELRFETPNNRQVSSTNDDHPEPQCRVDTYFQGALCSVDYEEPVSKSNYKTGTCNRDDGDTLGLRPLCWFKPNSNNRSPFPFPFPGF